MAEEESRLEMHARRAQSRKLILERAAAKERALRAAVDEVLRTEAGRTVFKFLFSICGYDQADIPQDALRNVDSGVLLYNTTRRSVYVKLRSKASRALLTPVEEAAEVETGAVEEDTNNEEST